MNVNDFNRALTVEDLIRRYNLNNLKADRQTIKQNNDSLVKTDKLLKDFVNSVTKNLEDLQDQVDGNITTWFYNGVPTLENNPAVNWSSENEKTNHLGDLYYDQETGYAYRFALSNNLFVWLKITDSDITKALAIANSAQDTADSKRRIFVVEPTPPYDVGDIWLKEDKDIYRCRAKRIEGNFQTVDWILGTDYTNDDYAKNVEAVLNDFKTTVEEDYVTNVRLETTAKGIESSVESTTTKIQKQIDNNFTIANNNYLETQKRLENLATVENITQLRQSVETLQTSTQASIKVINETLENGVSKVKTEKGFTFDDNGFTIDELNSPTKLNADTNAIIVTDKSGNTGNELLFAGYDESLLKSIVRVANIWAKRYLSVGEGNEQGDWRIEIVEDDDNGVGLGFFYMGDDV